jgi:lambda repressor-like predicted transcriptional regulator
MADKTEDTSMEHVHARFKESGLSLHALGLAMGYEPATARQAAFQFMKSGDPRISMLRRFAKAMGITVEELLGGNKKNRSK